MAVSRGLIANTPREAAARGCRARLSHLISISLAWSLSSRSLARAHARHLQLTQHARSSQEPMALPSHRASCANSRAFHDISVTSVSGGRISARLHPSSVQNGTHSRTVEPSRATRLRPAPRMSTERHCRSKMDPIFSVTPMGSRAAATGDQLQDLGHGCRRQAPSRPCRLGPRRDARERRLNLPLSRSPRRRAVGWPPSRDSGATSRGSLARH